MQNYDAEQALTVLLNELMLTAANSGAGKSAQLPIRSAIAPDSVEGSSAVPSVSPPAAQQTASTVTGTISPIGYPESVLSGNKNDTSRLEEELQRLTGQVTILRQVNELNQEVLNENTRALSQASVNQNQGSSSGAASTAKSIGSFLLGGLGIGSLVSEIASLFGSDDQPAPPTLVKYSPPPALQYEGAVMGNGQVSSYDYNDRGGIRAMDSASMPQAQQSNPTANQHVVIQVNAMDSKSFLDHSDDIARAVRAAILNSSSLNDVISEM